MNTMTLEQFADFVPPRPTYALFGDPVEHSVSPQLHQLLLESHGLPCDYVAVRVPAPELGRALQLARGKIRGCNLTIPTRWRPSPIWTPSPPPPRRRCRASTPSPSTSRAA